MILKSYPHLHIYFINSNDVLLNIYCVKHAKVQVFFDSRFPVSEQNCRFSSYAGKRGSKKTCIVAYFTVDTVNYLRQKC